MVNTKMRNEQVIDQLVLAYNAHDPRAFADLFTEDAIHGTLHAESQQRGREEIYHRYVEVFANFPENKTKVVQRTAFGQFVVDHELVQRSPTTEPFNVVAIYTLEADLIKRLDFVRE
jgi:uncharacterized protein (TIGR02246 family)